jgi:hypothetical protein
MIPPFDPSMLVGPAQKILTGPPKMQEMAAKGIALGVMPADLVLLLVGLTAGSDHAVADLAHKTLGNLPGPALQAALQADLHPLAVHALATRYADRIDVFSRLLSMPRIDIETVIDAAKICSEEASEMIATNEERLLANPKLIEVLYLNKHTRMSTADRIIELAVRNNVEVSLPAWKEAAAAIQNELILEPSDEPNPDDELFRETVAVGEQLRQHGDALEDVVVEGATAEELSAKEKYLPLAQRIGRMTNSQKIRLAAIGTPEEIMLLINDPSPLVSLAAAKAPTMNEAVAEQIVKRRGISSEVLTVIGQKPEYLRNLGTKRDLMKHPKVPPSLALRLIGYFQEHELNRMMGDRNVSGSVRQLIKNHLERKKRG